MQHVDRTKLAVVQIFEWKPEFSAANICPFALGWGINDSGACFTYHFSEALPNVVLLPEDFLIDEEEAMARLDISKPTIKRRRKDGTLLTVPIEGTDLVRYSNNYISGKMIPR